MIASYLFPLGLAVLHIPILLDESDSIHQLEKFFLS
jgi:hypothetical protein